MKSPVSFRSRVGDVATNCGGFYHNSELFLFNAISHLCYKIVSYNLRDAYQ